MSCRRRFVVRQGLQGCHPLFEPYVLRSAMGEGHPDRENVSRHVMAQAAQLLGAMTGAEDMDVQRSRISQAPWAVQEALVRLYFDALYQVIERQRGPMH